MQLQLTEASRLCTENQKDLFQPPECQFSPEGQGLIHRLLKSLERNLDQNKPIKRLFHPTLGPISALGSKSALGNWTAFDLIKGAKLHPKMRQYFTHRYGPIFKAETDLSELQ